MQVTAIFELPVHIWMMRDAFNASYPSGRGRIRFDVVMPDDSGPIGASPHRFDLGEPESATGEQIVWAQEYGGFIPESLRPATAAVRVVITNVQAPIDSRNAWRTADHQLAEAVAGWFDDVRTWAEVVTGQDLDPNHRVYDAKNVGMGLTFLEPAGDGALGLIITTPRLQPLTSEQWRAILAAVGDGRPPPVEEVLSRDARAANRRGANRRAVIDAATACEIALARHVRERTNQLPEAQRRRIDDRTALGQYISIVEQSGLHLAVSVSELRELNALRNAAAHRGQAPSHAEAVTAINTATGFLSAHGLMQRAAQREPDGSEWIVAQDGTDDAGD